MPEYEYLAATREGVEVVGQEGAATVEDLARLLKKRRMSLIRAQEKRTKRIPFDLAANLVTELAQLLNSGLPLERGLQIIAEDCGESDLAALVDQLRKGIKRGDPFSTVLGQAGDFDPILIALVRVGEASGSLGKILGVLDSYYIDSRQTRRDVVAALSYPAVLALVSLLSIIGLALFVVPVFQDLFRDMPENKIPLGTQVVFGLSDFLLNYGWVLLLVAVVLGVGSVLVVRRSLAVRVLSHQLLIRAPLVGKLIAGYDASRFARALSIMLHSGMPLSQAMELVLPLFSNLVQRAGAEEAIRGLRKGIGVPAAFELVPHLPNTIHRFIKLGNETGNLAETTQRAADMTHDKVRNELRTFVAILDPLIIVVMGGAVGFMVISVLLAVFSLSDIR